MKTVILSLFIALTTLALSACSDGEAENAGERIDEAVSDVENKLEDACEQAKENMKLENDEC